MCALSIDSKSCAVGMWNVILRNHLYCLYQWARQNLCFIHTSMFNSRCLNQTAYWKYWAWDVPNGISQYMTRAEKGLKWLKTFSWGDSSHLHHSSFLCIIYGALVHAHIENMADMPWYCELCQLKNAIAHQRAQEPHLFSCHYNQLIIIFGEKRVIYCWKLNK